MHLSRLSLLLCLSLFPLFFPSALGSNLGLVALRTLDSPTIQIIHCGHTSTLAEFARPTASEAVYGHIKVQATAIDQRTTLGRVLLYLQTDSSGGFDAPILVALVQRFFQPNPNLDHSLALNQASPRQQ